MRTLTDHIVSADLPQSQLTINVLDEPGQGGANHVYSVIWNQHVEVGTAKGGYVTGKECRVEFQNGPIKEFGLNGITQEALLAIVIDRLRSFQAGPFSCRENAIALTSCEEALMWLQKRTRDRLARGVEGTNTK